MPWKLFPASRFADHASAWDTLQRHGANVPFLESAFIAPLLDVFGSGRELLALHQPQAGGSGFDAACIVTPTGPGRWQTFQPSQLPLGPWIAHPDAPLEELARSLAAALPGVVLGIGLTQLDPLLQPRPVSNAGLQTLDYIDTSYLDIAGSFDSYWDARGKNLRANSKKQRNKLAADGIEASLHCVSDAGDVPAAMVEYGRLEAIGWKAQGGTAIDADNPQGRFYSAMLTNFCALGRGRIYQYRFGDKVVAMDLCIDNGPVVVVLKTAYDEGLRSVSPSTLMRQEQFAAWWAEGRYRRIEFYGKTMEWHTRWTPTERRLYHATVYRSRLLGALHAQWRRYRPGALAATPTPALPTSELAPARAAQERNTA